MYVEGYKYGFLNNKEANRLEDLTIKYYSIAELYNMKYLFHFNTQEEEVREFKDRIFSDIEKDEENSSKLNDLITQYVTHIIQPKVFSLNKHLDKQLSIDMDEEGLNIKEETLLTEEELENIYEEVLRVIMKDGQRIYLNACWNGLNDRVLKRYR